MQNVTYWILSRRSVFGSDMFNHRESQFKLPVQLRRIFKAATTCSRFFPVRRLWASRHLSNMNSLTLAHIFFTLFFLEIKFTTKLLYIKIIIYGIWKKSKTIYSKASASVVIFCGRRLQNILYNTFAMYVYVRVWVCVWV